MLKYLLGFLLVSSSAYGAAIDGENPGISAGQSIISSSITSSGSGVFTIGLSTFGVGGVIADIEFTDMISSRVLSSAGTSYHIISTITIRAGTLTKTRDQLSVQCLFTQDGTNGASQFRSFVIYASTPGSANLVVIGTSTAVSGQGNIQTTFLYELAMAKPPVAGSLNINREYSSNAGGNPPQFMIYMLPFDNSSNILVSCACSQVSGANETWFYREKVTYRPIP